MGICDILQMQLKCITMFREREREKQKKKKGRGRVGEGRKERGGRRRGIEAEAELWYIVRNCA